VTPLLRKGGHEVYAPTLTGLGERSHLLRQGISLETHIRDVVNVLQFEDLRDVILVGHSYAGMVIAGVADVAPERLRHLVYLDAMTPKDGQSMLDYAGPKFEKDVRRRVDRHGDGWLFPYMRDWGTFGVTDKKDLEWMVPRLTSIPIATWEQEVRFRNHDALALPKTFIWCSGPGRTKKDVRKDWPLPADFPKGWGFYQIKTGHDAMITAPRELARILIKVARG